MRVAFFVTCLGDQFFADAAAAAVRLLRMLGVEVTFPEKQTCCGQPAFNAGYWAPARAMARHTVDVFAEADYVVLPSGSCAAMLRRHYPELLAPITNAAVARGRGDSVDARSGPETGAADGRVLALAGRTYELAQFIVQVLGVTHLGRGLEGLRVAYHPGCHALRELGEVEEPLTLLRNAGAELVEWEAAQECCGFGGLFSVKLPEVSVAMADRKLDTLPVDRDWPVLTSADGGCLLHLMGRSRHRDLPLAIRPLAELLWEATRGSP